MASRRAVALVTPIIRKHRPAAELVRRSMQAISRSYNLLDRTTGLLRMPPNEKPAEAADGDPLK